jgi:hypothetical protein
MFVMREHTSSTETPMPTAEARQKVADAANHRLNAHLRALTADEAQLLAEAVDAGAHVQSDSAYEDFLAGGPLPLSWGTHTPPDGKFLDGWAAGADERREAFYARMRSGDLSALVLRIAAERAALDRAA